MPTISCQLPIYIFFSKSTIFPSKTSSFYGISPYVTRHSKCIIHRQIYGHWIIKRWDGPIYSIHDYGFPAENGTLIKKRVEYLARYLEHAFLCQGSLALPKNCGRKKIYIPHRQVPKTGVEFLNIKNKKQHGPSSCISFYVPEKNFEIQPPILRLRRQLSSQGLLYFRSLHRTWTTIKKMTRWNSVRRKSGKSRL